MPIVVPQGRGECKGKLCLWTLNASGFVVTVYDVFQGLQTLAAIGLLAAGARRVNIGYTRRAT